MEGEHPEPIPWKTGRVGIVPALDATTPPTAPALVSAPAPVAAVAATTAVVASSATEPPKKKASKLSGSGIPPRRIAVVLKWSRRVSQVAFFALFMYFLFQTGFRGSFAARADAPVRLPLPVEGFLLADPEAGFSFFLENECDIDAGSGLDIRVAVVESKAQHACQMAPHGGLARTHRADQKHVALAQHGGILYQFSPDK